MFKKLLITTIFLPLILSAQSIHFEKQIWPILEAKCVECHRAPYEENGRTKKPKGELRLDAAWAIELGGGGGAVVIKGDPENSELLYRTNLPEDDDDFMPPVGKADPLTKEEKKLLTKWIKKGAQFGDWTGNLTGKPKTERKPLVFETQDLYKQLSEGLQPLEESKWAAVRQSGGRVTRLSDKSPLLEVDFRLTAETTTDEEIRSIRNIAEQVVHLNLSKTQISDQAMVEIGKLKRLVRLDLHKTNISDAEISQLKSLEHLRYLNLYSTQVSDSGLQSLQSLKNLRSIYLWNSKATPKGAKALAEAIPGIKISIK